MSLPTAPQKCFHILFTRSLRAAADDTCLLLHDESLDKFLDEIFEVSAQLDLSVTAINLRKNYQRHLVAQIDRQGDEFLLPEATRLALSNSTVILSLLDGDMETAPLRRSIIRKVPRTRGCRLAHIPGLTREIMELVLETNFEQITEDCELLAWFLGQGTETLLRTIDQTGHEHVLKMDLGGWSNEPLMSPGIIPPGSWGNFPPGEVFCCPDPQSVSGSICINGSIPGFRIEGMHEIILSFERGRLVSWVSAAGRTPMINFFEEHAANATARSDESWRMFCEFGIGLNSTIRSLTGNSLFDEKAARTVHVAIGDNTAFGHTIEAKIHADMVSWFPTVSIFGTKILKGGELSRAELKNLRDRWSPPDFSLARASRHLRIRHAKTEVMDGLLLRRLSSGDRVGTIQMADDATSRALAALHKTLSEHEGIEVGRFLTHFPAFADVPTARLLAYMDHYGCLIPTADVNGYPDLEETRYED
jgi:hypothetical protein